MGRAPGSALEEIAAPSGWGPGRAWEPRQAMPTRPTRQEMPTSPAQTQFEAPAPLFHSFAAIASCSDFGAR